MMFRRSNTTDCTIKTSRPPPSNKPRNTELPSYESNMAKMLAMIKEKSQKKIIINNNNDDDTSNQAHQVDIDQEKQTQAKTRLQQMILKQMALDASDNSSRSKNGSNSSRVDELDVRPHSRSHRHRRTSVDCDSRSTASALRKSDKLRNSNKVVRFNIDVIPPEKESRHQFVGNENQRVMLMRRPKHRVSPGPITSFSSQPSYDYSNTTKMEPRNRDATSSAHRHRRVHQTRQHGASNNSNCLTDQGIRRSSQFRRSSADVVLVKPSQPRTGLERHVEKGRRHSDERNDELDHSSTGTGATDTTTESLFFC